VIATYNRADVLISQVREDVTSYYLFDGHGDVRALINEEGRISDKYRYNAYGELVERSGETENHYLYTGEYYDGTSNLYYLRARYMNPSTGTFISMDTYEGSIYDPDTLHKYLYANGNPVKYSDPTGNFFSGIGSFMATTIHTTLNNAAKLNVMGVISGVTSSAITTFLGGNTDDAIKSFIVGYIGGFGMGAVLCVAAAYGVVVYAQMLLLTTTASVAMTVTMMVYSIIHKKNKEVIVYSVLSVLSLLSLYQSYNLCASLDIIGDTGFITIDYDASTNDIKQANQLGKKYKVPNPNGKKGGDAHQATIRNIKPTTKGGRIENEVKFDTPDGNKHCRYADAVEIDSEGKIIRIYQVGKMNKNGTPVKRERLAIEDILKSKQYNGVEIYFLPYNMETDPMVYQGGI